MAHRQESGRSRRVACAKHRVLIERLQTAALIERILRPYTTPNILRYMPRFSILDLAAVRTGGTIAEAYRNTVDLAQHADGWGFTRFWLAEHHNMPGIASAATSVLIGHVAGKTSTIRVGSGGVMLPNHSPLVIAEQFGTLETLSPGRIDLGVGRAPGSDELAARALRYDTSEDNFPRQVAELLAYLEPARPGQRLRAFPGA